jgi:hypothetical protein
MKKTLISIYSLLVSTISFSQNSITISPSSVEQTTSPTFAFNHENRFVSYSNSINRAARFTFLRSRGTPTTPSYMHELDRIFTIRGIGNTENGDLGQIALVGEASQDWNEPFFMGTRFKIYTTLNNTNTPTTKFLVDHDGKVGINTGFPGAKLGVNGNFRLFTQTITTTTNTTYDPLVLDKSNLYFNPTTITTYTLKGIQSPPHNVSLEGGYLLYICSGPNAIVVLKNQSAIFPEFDILTNNGADITITGKGGATLMWHDGGWTVIGLAQ